MVHSLTLIRLSIEGAVGRPGFYSAPADALVTDVIMIAGGPGQQADLQKIKIERGSDDTVWEGEELQAAIIQGRTLDQLSIQAGDRIVVPSTSTASFWTTFRLIAITIPPIAFLLTRVF